MKHHGVDLGDLRTGDAIAGTHVVLQLEGHVDEVTDSKY